MRCTGWRGHVSQPLQRQRQVRAAARLNYGMDLVDDDRAHGPEHLPASFGRQKQVERLGRGHQDVRRLA